MKIHLVGWSLMVAAIAVSPLRAQTEVDSPIRVPLHFTPTDAGPDKLGIYVGIGAGATPALFEFDTGGVGFYAAYSAHAGVSPWWGAHQVVSSVPSITNAYDSGLTYDGRLAEAAISLHGSSVSGALITTASTAQLGRMDHIVQKNPSTGTVVETLWTNDSTTSTPPPINGAFYGDFGMNLAYNTSPNSSGLSNLLAQLTYGPGVTAGFRIHADAASGQAWLQIGLTAADTASSTADYFWMNPDADAPPGASTPVGDLPYYSQQLFTANVTIEGGTNPLVSTGVGMTPDTGASTTLHNTQNSSAPLPDDYSELITWRNEAEDLGDLNNGLQFSLSGTTTTGQVVSFFQFPTTSVPDAGNVMVQNNRPSNPLYYLNTGISLFYQYDLIYNIEDGIIGLDSVPEPSSLGLLAASAMAAGFAGFLYRRRTASLSSRGKGRTSR